MSNETIKFDIGDVVATPASLRSFNHDFIKASFKKHATGDWGDLDAEDKAANEEALVCGDRIFSAYVDAATDEKLYIITEADRSVTTLLLPSEY